MADEQQRRKVDSMRKRFRAHLDYFNQTKKDNLGPYSKAECKDFKACLKNYMDNLIELNTTYLDLLPNTNDEEQAAYDAEVEEVLRYNDIGILCLSAVDNKLDELKCQTMTTNSGTIDNNHTGGNHSKAKLKPLELPTYSGKVTENFAEFLDTVEEMLGGRGLENIEKFIHLKGCLSGDPLHAISALRNKDESWEIAKQTLLDLFSDTDEKKFELLNSFNNLRFHYSDSILSYFSKVDDLLKEIDTVKIDIKYVLQFFLWNSIRTNKTLTDIYRKVTEEAYPTFQQLTDNKRKVMKLYSQQQAEYKEFKLRKTQNLNKNKLDKNICSLAANIPNSRYSKPKSSIWCILCKGTTQDNEHAMFRCPQFVTSKEKLARLKFLKCCTRCGFSKHTSNSCNYALKSNCKHCNSSRHLSWLCPVNESAKNVIENDCESVKDESESEREEEEEYDLEYDDEAVNDNSSIEDVNVSMCATKVNRCCLPSNAILPTFRGVINGKSARGLVDTGCQMNFIGAALMKKAGLKPGQCVQLTVSGFNSAKTYRTYEVQVPLEFGGKVHDLVMVVLPEVSTKFLADGVSSVAVGFETKGYVLADPELKYDRNIVDNLEMVLGISASHVFREKVRMFGEDEENYFLETAGGVMPIGHSLKVYSNLKYLPHADKNPEISNKVKLSSYNDNKLKNEAQDSLEVKNNKPMHPPVVPKFQQKNSESKNSKSNTEMTKVKSKLRSRSLSQKRFLSNRPTLKKPAIKPHISKKPTDKKSVLNKISSQNSNTQPLVKFKKIEPEHKNNVKKTSKKVGNTSIATPATIEIRSCNLAENDKKLEKESTFDKDNSNDNSDLLNSYKLSKIGKNFLQSLTPGYSKQQVFGDCSWAGMTTEIDLDQLMSDTLGYDKYEKTAPYSDIDSKIVDYVYDRT